MTEVEKSYVAGILDGEGYIGVYKYGRKRTYGRGPYLHTCRIAITNTDIELLQAVRAMIGCGYFHTRKRENPKWKIAHQLQFTSRQALELINQVSPYLIRKKKHAKLILELKESIDRHTPRKRKRLEQEEFDLRERICEQVKALNKRGIENEIS